jgi:hypothetical protein
MDRKNAYMARLRGSSLPCTTNTRFALVGEGPLAVAFRRGRAGGAFAGASGKALAGDGLPARA